jgi:hypothetical protein
MPHQHDDYRSLSSHTVAWNLTRGCPGATHDSPPTDQINWATSGYTNVTTYAHKDGQGTGTVIRTIAGCKYWVTHKQRADRRGRAGDIMCMWGFEEGDMGDSLSEYFQHEAVVLTPQTIL